MNQHSDAERIRAQERQRIAHDLHDELGSHLSALKMALAHLQQHLPARNAGDAALQAQAAYADRLVDGALNAMHEIIDDLHPAVLDLGLPTALESLAQVFSRQTAIPHHVFIDAASAAASAALDSFQRVTLYRIAREALHNAARHAQASQIDISLRLEQRSQPPCLLLDICDDGNGLPADALHRAHARGLRGMQTRTAALDASLTLLPGANGGTSVQVSLPISALSMD